MSTRAARKPKPRLTRQGWIDAGIQLLTEQGIGAVSIETLAAQLGVTRGSFYHHFGDRTEFLQAMLDDWAQRLTFDIAKQVDALDLDPATTLLVLSKMIRSQKLGGEDAPFRAWALHDAQARAVLEKVDAVRLGTIRAQFAALGFSEIEAENRARLLLFYEITAPVFFGKDDAELNDRLLMDRHAFLTDRRAA